MKSISDPLFALGDGDATDLPGALAQLARGEALEFARLRAHQEQAFFQFLVQLAAVALARADEHELPDAADDWRELLLDLTDGAIEPWTLVVEDPSKPAFFQPPAPEGTLDGYTNEAASPEALDILVTAKNHDSKVERFIAPQLDAWAYALITLQTNQGYSGRANYGIARMNGGLSSRPWIGLTPSQRWGNRFARDVRMLLDLRDDLLDDEIGYRDDGLALLWLEPWDGEDALRLDQLDPYFIEICRRVRLVDTPEGLRVRWTTTQSARIDAKDRLGHLGDPWTPTRRKGDAVTAFTASASGLHYRLLTDLLFEGGEYEPAPAQTPRREDRVGESDPLFVARVLVRGQGETGGLHERAVPIPADRVALVSDPEARRSLAKLARLRIEQVAAVQNKALRPALRALLQGAPEELNRKDDRPKAFVDRLDHEVDRIFFEHLWNDIELDADEQVTRWNRTLFERARALFEEAIETVPSPDARHYRALALAERRFYGAAYKLLPGLSDPRPEDPQPDDSQETDDVAA